MTMKIKITDNRKLLREYLVERVWLVDLVIGKVFNSHHRGHFDDPIDDDRYIDISNQTIWFPPHLFEIVQEVDKGDPCIEMINPVDPADIEAFGMLIRPRPIKLDGNPDKWTDKERVFAALNLIYILDQYGKSDPETRDQANETRFRCHLPPEIIQMGKRMKDQIKEARDIALYAARTEQFEGERPSHS